MFWDKLIKPVRNLDVIYHVLEKPLHASDGLLNVFLIGHYVEIGEVNQLESDLFSLHIEQEEDTDLPEKIVIFFGNLFYYFKLLNDELKVFNDISFG